MSDTIRRLQENRVIAGKANRAARERNVEMQKMQRFRPEMAADTNQLQGQFKMTYPVAKAVAGQMQNQRKSGYIMPQDAARTAASMDGIYTPQDDLPGLARGIEDQMMDQKAAEMRRKMAASRPQRPVGIN